MEILELNHEVIRTARDSEANQKVANIGLQEPERLPFTVRIAVAREDVAKAVAVRRSAYGRHLPEFARTMTIEDTDVAPGTTILLAESRLDRAPIGTMRIQTNEFAELPVEHSVELPSWCASGRLAEATRLAVAGPSSGRMVKMMLFKALFLLCEQRGIDWLLITARSPIDREYEAMLFRDIFADHRYVPMTHVGGLPHRVMAGEVSAARRRWSDAKHPLYRFVFETPHPDLNLTQPARGAVRLEAAA
ncbi:N-acyl amino acid synthase FeeM domain-containing protein [Paraburkholderia diazotrophica]|uniref:N-acyl amino acid synthase FeeM domain-containing protein n=1 Tax=Paraburkholderia diazotrophica TaxID=667676 RepID=UPI00316EAD7E